jgi:hypothetical protein
MGGAGDPQGEAPAERGAGGRARDAGLKALQQISHADPTLRALCESAAADVQSGELGIASNHIASPAAAQMLGDVLTAQRQLVLTLRDDGEISEMLAERLITELDVDDMRLSGEVARLTGGE